MAREPYLVTTAPVGPARAPGLALARELVGADVVARHQRRLGHDVRLVAASLEHGRHVERAAYERGGEPQDFADEWAERYEETLAALHVRHDELTRTSDPQHQRVVKAFFLKLFDEGDIAKGPADAGPAQPRCDELLAPPPGPSESGDEDDEPGPSAPEASGGEAYFFKASKCRRAVLDHLADHPEFVLPDARRQALLEAVERDGLPDVCISRARHDWAIRVPISPQHVMDCAFDGLVAYLTSCGYLADPQMFARYWPPQLQVVGPSALAAHALVWPALLLAAELPLPRRLLVRGRFRLLGEAGGRAPEGLTDPAALAERIGADALRFGLLRAAPYTEDCELSPQEFIGLGNRHLTDGLGRLAEMTLAAIRERRDGAVPRPGSLRDAETGLVGAATALFDITAELIEAFDFPGALDSTWGAIDAALAYAEATGVAALAAGGAEPQRLDTALYVLAEVCRLLADSLAPFLPGAAAAIETRFAVDYGDRAPADRHEWGLTQARTRIEGAEPLFPHLVLPTE